jgi:hypothetical protein
MKYKILEINPNNEGLDLYIKKVVDRFNIKDKDKTAKYLLYQLCSMFEVIDNTQGKWSNDSDTLKTEWVDLTIKAIKRVYKI